MTKKISVYKRGNLKKNTCRKKNSGQVALQQLKKKLEWFKKRPINNIQLNIYLKSYLNNLSDCFALKLFQEKNM